MIYRKAAEKKTEEKTTRKETPFSPSERLLFIKCKTNSPLKRNKNGQEIGGKHLYSHMLSVNLGTNDSQNGFIYFNKQRNPVKKNDTLFSRKAETRKMSCP